MNRKEATSAIILGAIMGAASTAGLLLSLYVYIELNGVKISI